MKQVGWSSLFVGAVLLAVAPLAEAQQQAKVPKIGLLRARLAASGTSLEGFLRELRALGYVEGKNIIIESRSAEGKLDRLPALVDELVRLKVDVLVTPSTVETLAAKNATRTISIVCLNLGDAVASGLVDSLARPGGNITGFTGISGGVGRQTAGGAEGDPPQTLSRCGAVDPREYRRYSRMERKPTASHETWACSFIRWK